MKIVTKLASILLILALALSIASCGVNSYFAIGMYRGSVSNMSELSFASLNGRIGLNLKNTYKQDTSMSVKASLTAGSVEVYYRTQIMPEEVLAFELTAGQEFSEENFGYLTNGEDAVFYVVAPEGVTAEGFKLVVRANEPATSSDGAAASL